jgi:hypothetical protein
MIYRCDVQITNKALVNCRDRFYCAKIGQIAIIYLFIAGIEHRDLCDQMIVLFVVFAFVFNLFVAILASTQAN